MRERLLAWACARVGARGGSACVPDSRRGRCAERASRPSCSAPVDRCSAWHAAAGMLQHRLCEGAREPRRLLAGNCPSLCPLRWRGGAIAAWSAANALPVGAAPSAHRRQFTPCNARARGLLRAWARPRGSSQGACQAARPSEPSGGLQAAPSRRSTSDTAAPKRPRAAGGSHRYSQRTPMTSQLPSVTVCIREKFCRN